MAFSLVTTAYKTDDNAAKSSYTCNAGGNGGSAGQVNMTAGQLIVATMNWEANDVTAAAMDNITGLTWTAGTKIKQAGNAQWGRAFYAIATGTITNYAPTCSTAESPNYGALIVSVFSAGSTIVYNAELAESVENQATATSAGTLATTGSAGLIVVGAKTYSGSTFTAGTNFTLTQTSSWHAQEYRTVSSAGNYNMIITSNTSQYWTLEGMSFSESGGTTKPAYYYAQL